MEVTGRWRCTSEISAILLSLIITVWITFCVSCPISSPCVLLLCFRGILCTTCWCYVQAALWCSVFNSLYHVIPYLQIHHRLLAAVYTCSIHETLKPPQGVFFSSFFFYRKRSSKPNNVNVCLADGPSGCQTQMSLSMFWSGTLCSVA